MSEPRTQVLDVNHFDNTVVVKFEDGKIALLDGVAVRHAEDAASESRDELRTATTGKDALPEEQL